MCTVPSASTARSSVGSVCGGSPRRGQSVNHGHQTMISPSGAGNPKPRLLLVGPRVVKNDVVGWYPGPLRAGAQGSAAPGKHRADGRQHCAPACQPRTPREGRSGRDGVVQNTGACLESRSGSRSGLLVCFAARCPVERGARVVCVHPARPAPVRSVLRWKLRRRAGTGAVDVSVHSRPHVSEGEPAAVSNETPFHETRRGVPGRVASEYAGHAASPAGLPEFLPAPDLPLLAAAGEGAS